MEYKAFCHYVNIENEQKITCGIKVFEDNKLIKTIFDVSTNIVAVQNLVKRMNEGKVEYCHMESILYDFYLDNY